MATEFGKEWRVYVGDGGGSEVFLPLGGEGSFDWPRQSKEIDISSKDDGAYATKGYGRQTVTIRVNGKLKLPDAGLERVAEVSKEPVPEANFQIRKNDIVKFAGLMSVGNFSTTHPDDEVCTWSFDCSTAAVPVVDNLGA